MSASPLPSRQVIARKARTLRDQIKAGNYAYIATIARNQIAAEVDHRLPTSAKLALAKLTRAAFLQNGQGTSGTTNFDPLLAPEFKRQRAGTHPTLLKHDSQSLRPYRAAVILDDFSMACWKEEFDTVEITPENWQKTLPTANVDFFLVESAWRGNGGAWAKTLNQPGEVNADLAAVIEWCRNHSIPAIFWNKEDPPHFDKFFATACLFDYVFTTDADKVPDYEVKLGKGNVGVLPFAAQPAVHNPARNTPDMPGIVPARWHAGDIAFAGTYMQDAFPQRRAQMDLLLGGAAAAAKKKGLRFSIFSRFGSGDPRYRFPDALRRYVVGSLGYRQMLSANKEHKLFLNVNSVTDSPTMCARRVFELPASGAAIVSTPSKATPQYFGPEELTVVSTQEEAEAAILALSNSKELRDRQNHRAQRVIWRQHTYAHRAKQIVEAAGLLPNSEEITEVPRVSIICSTNRPRNIQHVLAQVERQVNVEAEFIMALHGFKASDIPDLPSHVRVIEAPATWSLGECLNACVAQATGEFVAKFDDDDLYLPHYLEDQVNALHYSGADLVGKQAACAYLSSSRILMLRRPEREHLWTSFVAGPTLVARRETFLSHPFEPRTTGEDSAFIRSITASGGKIYSADRFNFVQVRNSEFSDHTWALTDTEFLSQGEVITYSDSATGAEDYANV